MREFAPARLAREAQGSFGNRMLPKPSRRALGFGYFPRKESNSLAAEASETKTKVLHSCRTMDESCHPWRSRCAPPAAFAFAILQTQSGLRRDDDERGNARW
jgi:hypothetical protein